MKNKFFQTVRGISIICVGLIHSLTEDKYSFYNNELNIIIRTTINFAVGIFIFLAGYFIRKDEVRNNTANFYKKKFKRLAIPYVIWSLIYTCVNYTEYIKSFSIKKIIFSTILGSSGA